MKRILSFVFVFILLFSVCVNAAMWDIESPIHKGTEMALSPKDNYTCMQNPPSFTWPKAKNAISYEIKICSDSKRNNIVYEAKDIKLNLYCFPHTFEPGTYYWSLRYKKNGNVNTSWYDIGRFLVDANAYPFGVPTVEEMLDRIPSGHPRAYFSTEEIQNIRENYSANPDIYPQFKQIMKLADSYNPDVFVTEPTFDIASNSVININIAAADKIYISAMAYMLTGNEKYANTGIAYMMKLCQWNPHGASSFIVNDQGARDLIFKVAIAYDWLYDLMTEDERNALLAMEQERLNHYKEADSISMAEMIADSYVNTLGSHTWTVVEYMAIAGYCFYGDIPEAEELLRVTLPLIAAFQPPWSNEDGGWAQGTSYWGHSSSSSKMLATLLKNAGIIDMYSKTWSINEPFGMMYLAPHGAQTLFGDEANRSYLYGSLARAQASNAIHSTNPYAKWHSSKLYANWQLSFMLLYDAAKGDTYSFEDSPKPYALPLGRYFKDTGWTASHSSLTDTDRVSLYFKSSPYGTYSHSHSDQNSFVIDAYGERLAFDAGYYDAWGSEFDFGFTRKSYAHNTITHSNGVSQPVQDFTAKGKITDYIYTPSFDLTAGDATDAYEGKVGKVKRNIIYIRPDTFVVLDDLKAAEEEETTFEFWLQAEKEISLTENGRGAVITQGNARLEAEVCYPQSLKSFYSDLYTGTNPDDAYTPPDVLKETHKRVWFQTDSVNSIRMLTLMDVSKTGEHSAGRTYAQYNDYGKIEFEDGTVVYVNLTGAYSVSADNYTFKGDALLVKGGSYMLVNGTEFIKDGKNMVKSNEAVSVALDGEVLSVSSLSKDCKVKIYTPGLSSVRKVEDDRVFAVPSIGSNTGIEWTARTSGDSIFTFYPGTYTMYLNDAPVYGTLTEASDVSATVNSIPVSTVSKTYLQKDDNYSEFCADIADGFYKVTNSDINLPFGYVYADSKKEFSYNGSGKMLSLEGFSDNVPVATLKKQGTVFEEPSVYKTADSYIEKENQNVFRQDGSVVFTSSSAVSYDFENLKNGAYDVILEYSTNNSPYILVSVNGKGKTAGLRKTDGNVYQARIFGGFIVDDGRAALEIATDNATMQLHKAGLVPAREKLDSIALDESFDGKTYDELKSEGWSFSLNSGGEASVEKSTVLEGDALLLTDNDYDSSSAAAEYRVSCNLSRSFGFHADKVAIETQITYKAVGNRTGNMHFDILGNDARGGLYRAISLVVYSSGKLGCWIPDDQSTYLVSKNALKDGETYALRIEADLSSNTYNFYLYDEAVSDAVISFEDVPFYNSGSKNVKVDTLTGLYVDLARYTSGYAIEYFTVYPLIEDYKEYTPALRFYKKNCNDGMLKGTVTVLKPYEEKEYVYAILSEGGIKTAGSISKETKGADSFEISVGDNEQTEVFLWGKSSLRPLQKISYITSEK